LFRIPEFREFWLPAPYNFGALIPVEGVPSMNKHWFSSHGWICLPQSWQGLAITASTNVFCVASFVAVDRHSHSVSDTVFGVFPYIVPAFLLLNWVASKTSQRASRQDLP
jgi:hypothetical protein